MRTLLLFYFLMKALRVFVTTAFTHTSLIIISLSFLKIKLIKENNFFIIY